MFEEYNNGVPDRLRQVTAETMSPEVLYTLDTYPDDFIADALMLSMATKRLMITMELMMKSTIRTTSRLSLQ